MTITLDLAPELIERLAKKAAQNGQDSASYAINLLSKDLETDQQKESASRIAKTLAVLESFMKSDEQEQRETFEFLQKAIDDDRPGQRRIFGEGTNP